LDRVSAPPLGEGLADNGSFAGPAQGPQRHQGG